MKLNNCLTIEDIVQKVAKVAPNQQSNCQTKEINKDHATSKNFIDIQSCKGWVIPCFCKDKQLNCEVCNDK